jgi:hypothetical protein
LALWYCQLFAAGCGAKLQLLESNMKKFYRGERNEVLTYEMLVEEYQRQLENGMTEATTIEEYIKNCLESALEEITDADVLAIADTLELDTDQIAELLEKMDAEDDIDFELAGARIIHKDFIDKIQQEELLSDLYCLGCFNANFLAGYLPLDTDDIEQLQKADAYTAIGKIAAKYIEEIQEGYAAADGYGHHFNGYDFSEIETDHYYVFPRAAE